MNRLTRWSCLPPPQITGEGVHFCKACHRHQTSTPTSNTCCNGTTCTASKSESQLPAATKRDLLDRATTDTATCVGAQKKKQVVLRLSCDQQKLRSFRLGVYGPATGSNSMVTGLQFQSLGPCSQSSTDSRDPQSPWLS